MRANRKQDGFTLVEALIAMLFMAVLFPVIVQAFLVANRAGTLAERSRIAAELADRKLTELVVTNEWQDGAASGDFGTDYPGYTWDFTSEDWEEDTMREVRVTVYYQVQDYTYHVMVATLAVEETDT